VTRKRIFVMVALAALPALTACGLRGGLERPEPLWGNPPIEGPNDPRVLRQEAERKAAEAKQKEDARKAAEAAAAATTPAPATPSPPRP
jgi:predicted small lipoprotein YifL